MLGLHCCAGFSLVSESKGYSPAAVRGLLIVAASLVENRLWGSRSPAVVAHGLCRCTPGF